MKENTLKTRLDAGETALGPFVGFPSPAMVEMMGWLGFDFVIIDCEHGPADYETAEHMIRAAEVAEVTPILRIGLNAQQHIQRYLDSGASGVLIPLVNTAAEATDVVNSVKYPPMGKRGMFGNRPTRYGSMDVGEYLERANEQTFVAVQIETVEGIANQAEIAAVDGLDAVFIGPGDLAVQLGVPGQQMHPKVLEAAGQLVRTIRDAGKHAGTLGVTLEQTRYWHERGVRWLVSSGPRHLQNGARGYLEEIRGSLGL